MASLLCTIIVDVHLVLNHICFVRSVLGVPRDADFSLAKRHGASNTGVEKKGKREKTHFYQDLLLDLGLKYIHDRIHNENMLEMEFFDYAKELNANMIDEWKLEA